MQRQSLHAGGQAVQLCVARAPTAQHRPPVGPPSPSIGAARPTRPAGYRTPPQGTDTCRRGCAPGTPPEGALTAQHRPPMRPRSPSIGAARPQTAPWGPPPDAAAGLYIQPQPSRRWTSGAAARRARSPNSPAPATRRATTTTINTRSAQPTDLSWVCRRSAPADHAGRSCHRHHCATAAAAITAQTQRLHHGAGTVVHPSATAIAATHQVGADIPITRTHSRQGHPASAPPERRAQPQHRRAAIDTST